MTSQPETPDAPDANPRDPVPVVGPVVFFTGAGISVGSGLPTYRGRGGLYQASAATPPSASDITIDRLPALWARFRARLRAADEAGPSIAHRAIVELESRLAQPVTVVTQNVDGLHSTAGSRRIIELHGTLRTMRCLDHQHVTTPADADWEGDVPYCPGCGSICRPNVVLFGEQLPATAWDDAATAIADAATVVAVGTSAFVYPAAFLIAIEASTGAERIWVNPETEPPDDGWTWLRGTADTQVPRLRPR